VDKIRGEKTNIFYNILVSMRPKQWTKNGFVLAGLIFSKSFLEIVPVLRTILALVLFSLVSGSLYMVNDIIDRERDALHPQKSLRPIASGKLNIYTALACSMILLAVSLSVSFLLSFKMFLALLTYTGLVLVYSLWLKKIVIVDVIIISLGFVLRVAGGSLAINVKISPWLIVCTTLLALFLALNKRKSELTVLARNAAEHRENLGDYTPELIDRMLSVVTSTTVMSYSLYTFNAGKSYYMMLTIPFVLYGIFRYQYITLKKDKGGSPEMVLLNDRPLLINVILWVVSSLIIVACFY
jgi:4-hydroxybenzoate polyprenyltransferase